ncbi:NAD(P)-binding oxidoreductase [Olivibacter sp. CPCC 100613]|uniref:NAD(P)-dependent oxidoreductase n=1 Tax=Olivibacter sp. CPCC 100613 TaxID=3079931 RepID=UPI002FFC0025
MNLVVFGSTGSIGKLIVKQALQEGHHVTAFTRSPQKLQEIANPLLRIFKGDLNDSKTIQEAVKNQDAVLCAIGDGNKGGIRASGTRNIIDAMEQEGIRRLICETTLGLGDSAGNLNFFWKHVMFGLFLKKAFKDHQLQEHYLLTSNLDYTIVRPSAFTDGVRTDRYKIGFGASEKGLSLKIARADVASFMLNQVAQNEYRKKAVSISN